MANPFLNKTDLMDRDIETAVMLEQATVHNIGNAIAYTDGNKIYINTDDRLNELLPAYDQRMLKWLLWHERYHIELRHHNRFFKYMKELIACDIEDKFNVTQDEINIIMDILVHDSLSKMFPDLVEIAQLNLAQMRNRNSLQYTFKTFTLEEMLNEYKAHKKGEDTKDDKSSSEEDEGKTPGEKTDDKEKDTTPSKKKDHAEGSDDKEDKSKAKREDGEPEIKDESERPAEEPLKDEHDKTDWSKLEKFDQKEFITESESDEIQEAINKIKRTKFKLAKLTETLNGLVTTTRRRSYAMPSTTYCGSGIILKGSTPGRALLYLVFDASGSMGSEMELFKEIISKSIPQAMETTCEWFAGRPKDEGIKPYKIYKTKFKDFTKVYASSGYEDDGDRTIELCWQAEQAGYTPIGVTDGGGQISWSKDKLKQLKKTVLVGQNAEWLDKVRAINPRIETLSI